jgi:hypothetical protein
MDNHFVASESERDSSTVICNLDVGFNRRSCHHIVDEEDVNGTK